MNATPPEEKAVTPSNDGNEIPAWLERSTPRELKETRQFWKKCRPFGKLTVRAMLLSLGVKPEAVSAMAGLFSAWGCNFGEEVPEFARLASKLAMRHLFEGDFSPMGSVHDAGMMVRMIEVLPDKPGFKLKGKLGRYFAKTTKPLVMIFEACARSLSTKETAEFYAGRAECDEVLEKLENTHRFDMVKTFKVYVIIAARFKQFETFNGGEAIRFLRAERVIQDNCSDRELYQIFARIKLPLGNCGRPRALLPENTVS